MKFELKSSKDFGDPRPLLEETDPMFTDKMLSLQEGVDDHGLGTWKDVILTQMAVGQEALGKFKTVFGWENPYCVVRRVE